MKQKIIIGFSVLLLLAVVYLIGSDLFTNTSKNSENPTEYKIDKLRQIDSSLICYKEINQFNSGINGTYGLAMDENKTLYVAGNKQVAFFNVKGIKTGGFSLDTIAHCIAIDKEQIYLGAGNHIMCFSTSGDKISTWPAYNEKSFITSLVINGNYLYVADAINKRLFKYDKNGNLQWEIGKQDTARGMVGFVIPSPYFEVAFGSFNDLWVVNPGKHIVAHLSDDGEIQSSWGIASFSIDGFSGCCNPSHLAILPNGDFVTYEKGLERIKIYDPTGKFKCVVAGPESFMSLADLSLQLTPIVADLTTDIDGTIYVLDATNTIRVFVRK